MQSATIRDSSATGIETPLAPDDAGVEGEDGSPRFCFRAEEAGVNFKFWRLMTTVSAPASDAAATPLAADDAV